MDSPARKFLESVLVWPGSAQAPGWINVHVNARNVPKPGEPIKNGGKPWVTGWPFKTVDDALDRISWAMSTDIFFNAWVCMSQQSECTQKADGKRKAVRKAANATWLKAIWIDCDVKASDAQHYHSMPEAFNALTSFRHKVGLPFPSLIVNSGGGLHVYWVSDTPLTPDQWRPYADGLKSLLLREGVKCDTGLTTDIARILRVPGTKNHKYDPPRDVELLHSGAAYNFGSQLQFLTQFTSHVASVSPNPQLTVIEPGADFSAPDPAFASLKPDDALQAGAHTGPTYVDPKPIFAKDGCPWLREALRTGGKDFDQPQWNLSVLCTAFMENGNAFAHEISKGHTGYTPVDTENLYQRKVADRTDRGIGYPSCAAIEGAGCALCAGCVHRPKGKSPLNIRAPQITATVKNPVAASLDLPDDYDLDEKGRVCLIVKKHSKEGYSEEWLPLFHNQITKASVQKGPDTLNLYISLDKGHWDWASLRSTEVAGAGYEKKLTQVGLLYTKHKAHVEAFIMSFIAKLKAAAESQQSLSFGWHRPQGPIEGFSVAGELIKTDGSRVQAALHDGALRKYYTPSGTVADWHTTASYILRQRRPDFDCIIASAFAAPLMEFTGTTAAVLATPGEKGSGKSYAMEVAAAVWGNHKETIERKKSTDKSVINKLGQLGNLPLYWDEISDPVAQARFLEVQNELSGGGEGSRLTQNIQHRERGKWCTVANINGNRSWRDYVVSKQQDHGAGLRRVLEYWVTKDVLNPQGQVPISESEKARGLILHSYGHVGTEYVEYIVTHLEQVQQIIARNTGFFEAKLHPDKEESMWLALCTTLLSGAEIANLLPTPVGFNTNRLFGFLLNMFLENRRYMAGANVNPVDTAEDYLAQYLKDRFNEMIWTHGVPSGLGRGHKVEWRRLQPNASTSHGVSVRWDRMSMTLRFSRTNFFEWCLGKPDNRDPNVIVRALQKTHGMTGERKMLASGTPFKMPQEHVYIIDVSPHQDLRDIMDAFVEATNINQDLGTPTGVTGATGTHGP